MRASRDVVLLGVLLSALACTSADPPAPAPEPVSLPAPVPGAETADLAGFAWLLGEWRSEQDGKTMEELWTQPAPDLMLGLHRDTSASGEISFEYMRIEKRADGVVYIAALPKQQPVGFRLEKIEPSRVVFVNPEHDYPQRILYSFEDGVLRARIEGDTPEGAKLSEWLFEDAD